MYIHQVNGWNYFLTRRKKSAIVQRTNMAARRQCARIVLDYPPRIMVPILGATPLSIGIVLAEETFSANYLRLFDAFLPKHAPRRKATRLQGATRKESLRAAKTSAASIT
jgi:hypothetical protein